MGFLGEGHADFVLHFFPLRSVREGPSPSILGRPFSPLLGFFTDSAPHDLLTTEFLGF